MCFFVNVAVSEGAKIVVTYTDESTEEKDITVDMLSGYTNETVGNGTATVTYGGQTCSIAYTVSAYDGTSYITGIDYTTVEGTDGTGYVRIKGLNNVPGSLKALWDADKAKSLVMGKTLGDFVTINGTTITELVAAKKVARIVMYGSVGFGFHIDDGAFMSEVKNGAEVCLLPGFGWVNYTADALGSNNSCPENYFPVENAVVTEPMYFCLDGSNVCKVTESITLNGTPKTDYFTNDTVDVSGLTLSVASLVLACSLAFSAACVGGDTDEDDLSYPGYDESLRVEDTRSISDVEYTEYNIVGTDDYGRRIMTVDGKDDGESYVGMFFFLTLGQHTNHRGIYDISKITQDGLDLDAFQSNSRYSPEGAAHFWGEPVFGYYNSEDEWVIRKQIELLTLAGIDFIVLDTSNAELYRQVTDVLFPVMLEYYNKGWNVPKVMYYLAANDGKNERYPKDLRTVYDYFYATDTYRPLWFCPNGKPMITRHELANNEFLKTFDGGKYLDFFEFRTRQWPNNDYLKPDGAAWMEFQYPQPLHTDWISISVAQHYSVRFSDTVGTHGRGWNEETSENDHENYGKGLNYQTQWQTAFDYKNAGDNVKFAFITGWNEWVAEKKRDGNTYFTVDTFNEEYSRDIEPCVNEKVADNFYMQTIRNVRTFNYTEAKHYVYPKTTIDVTKDDDKWNAIRPYVDFTDDCKDRNFKGMVSSLVYTDNSGRNDIETVKVARDDEYMYFRVTTVNDVTAYSSGDDKWMNILIKTDNAKKSWNGYSYVLNREVNGNVTSVMKADGKGGLTKKGEGDVHVYGKTMIVRVKLSLLGLSSTNYHVEFKVADNVADYDHVELYRSGDAAPIGRLNYSYGY